MKQSDILDRIAEPFIGYSLSFLCLSVVGFYISLEWFHCSSSLALSTVEHMNGAIVSLACLAAVVGGIYTATVSLVSLALQRLRNHSYRSTYGQHIACGLVFSVLFSAESAFEGINGPTILGWNALWILPIGSVVALIAVKAVVFPLIHTSAERI